MTKESLQYDLERYEAELQALDTEIGRMRAAVVQTTANANCVKGVVQYLQMRLQEHASGDEDHRLDHNGAEPVDRTNG